MTHSALSYLTVVWCVLFLSLALFCIVVVVKPRAPKGRAFWKSLFDFSAGQAEAQQTTTLLRQALAGAKTDADLERRCKALRQAGGGQDAEFSWAWLNRALVEYRRPGELDELSLVLAQRYLDDIARRFRLSEDAPSGDVEPS